MELAAVVDNIRAFLLKIGDVDLPRELATAAAELRTMLDDRLKSATQEMQAIYDEQQKLTALLDAINLEIWYADSDMNLMMVNEAARRWLGLEAYETSIPRILERLRVFDAAGQPRPKDAAPMLRALRGETVRDEMEIVQHPGNGHLLYREVDAAPVKNPEGKIIGAVASVRDISRIRQLETQTLKLYEITAALSQVMTLPEIIRVVEEKVFVSGEQFSGALGLLSEDETRVEIIAQFGIPAEIMKQYRSIPIESNAGLSLAIRTCQPYWVENLEQYAALLPENYAATQHSTGVQALFSLPLMVGNKAIGGLAVGFQQPTPFSEAARHFYMSIANHCAKALERTQLIEALQKQTKTIQQKNQELQEFAYIASHDLREPLRKVQQFTERLKADLGDTLGERHLDYLNRIQASNSRMQNLLEHLLTYSRITTHNEPFQRVDLNKVIQNVLADLEFAFQETGGKVTVEPLPMIDADPVQIQQLFQNLLHNALKFRRPGVPPEIKIRSQHERLMCHLLVEDNGIGFEEADAERIFLPFQRLHGRSQYEGYGMGLPICKRIVERHKGTITATSTVGAGSTFRVTLPLTQIGTRPLVLRGFARD